MTGTEVVLALIGIFVTFVVAVANLGWNVYTWLNPRLSAGAEDGLTDRKAALRNFKQRIRAAQRLVARTLFRTDDDDARNAEELGYQRAPAVGEVALVLLFTLNAERSLLAPHLHPEERKQLGELCGDTCTIVRDAAIMPLDERMRLFHGPEMNIFDSFEALDNWTLHLLEAASIDKYLGGVPVLWSGGDQVPMHERNPGTDKEALN